MDVPPVDPTDLLAAMTRYKSALRTANLPVTFEAAWARCFAHLSPKSRFALRLRLQAFVFTLSPARKGTSLAFRASLLGAAAEAKVWCIDQLVLFDPAELEERATELETYPAPSWATALRQ